MQSWYPNLISWYLRVLYSLFLSSPGLPTPYKPRWNAIWSIKCPLCTPSLNFSTECRLFLFDNSLGLSNLALPLSVSPCSLPKEMRIQLLSLQNLAPDSIPRRHLSKDKRRKPVAAVAPKMTRLTGSPGPCAAAPESPIHHLSTTWPEESWATVLWHVTSQACSIQRVDKNLSTSCLARWRRGSHKWDNKINCNHGGQALL